MQGKNYNMCVHKGGHLPKYLQVWPKFKAKNILIWSSCTKNTPSTTTKKKVGEPVVQKMEWDFVQIPLQTGQDNKKLSQKGHSVLSLTEN